MEHEVLRALKIYKHLSIYYFNNFRFSFLHFAQLLVTNFQTDLSETPFDENGERVRLFIQQFEKDIESVRIFAFQNKADLLFRHKDKINHYQQELSDCISIYDPTQRLNKVMQFL